MPTDEEIKKYLSKFSGAQFDEAIQKVLFGTGVDYGHIILECSESTKINLNDVTSPNTYSIAYYMNSYDDNSVVSPIVLTVTKINDGILEQRYQYGDNQVQRFYNSASSTWSDWNMCEAMASNFVSVNKDDAIEVKQPTLVFRKMSEVESEE